MLKVYTILCRAGKMDNYSYLLVNEKSGRKKKPLPRLPDVSSAEHVRRNVRRRIL